MRPIDDAVPEGTVLGGRYRVGRRLGGGGMGAVYEATQLDLGRRVAIKTLHRELRGDRPQVERFQREAIAAARLHHPNIIQVSDFVDRQPDPAFLVMEHFDAPNLQELAMAGPIPLGRLGGIALQVLAALEAAHAAGIVHRDLKPANVIVVPLAGGGDLVKLIDFGIARLAEGNGFLRLTQSGSIVGTPVYMSPEQARGLPVDGRTDLYALAVMLYRIIGGRPPFVGASLGELMPQILGMEPTPLWDLAPDVPRAFADVIHRSLRKSPLDRYDGAPAMAAAMRAALEGVASGVVARSERPRAPDAETAQARPGAARSGMPPTAPAHPVIPPTRMRLPTPVAAPTREPTPSASALPQTRAPRMVAAVAAVLAVGGATAVLLASSSNDDVTVAAPAAAPIGAPAAAASVPAPEPPDPPAAATPPVVTVSSDPAQAEVYTSSGDLIGNTPLDLERPAGTAVESYEIRAPGHLPMTIRISRLTQTQRPLFVTLEPEPEPIPTSSPSPVRSAEPRPLGSGDERDRVLDPWEPSDRHEIF